MPDRARISDVSATGFTGVSSLSLSEDSVRFALDHMDVNEQAEFREEFAKQFSSVDREPSQAAITRLFDYVREWVVSINLRENPDWLAQVAATGDENQEAARPVSIEGLVAILES